MVKITKLEIARVIFGMWLTFFGMLLVGIVDERLMIAMICLTFGISFMRDKIKN